MMTKLKKHTKKPAGYHFAECGLDYVYLVNGYDIDQEEESITIYNEDKLHREIARTVLLYRKNLKGQEIRFFRSLLRLTQAQLANKLSVARETVVRWENDDNEHQIPEMADGLLRIIVWEEYLDAEKAVRFFEEHKKDRVHYKTLEMMEAKNKWQSKLAA
jgi:DNA-binding transcriptional regulator YiaG